MLVWVWTAAGLSLRSRASLAQRMRVSISFRLIKTSEQASVGVLSSFLTIAAFPFDVAEFAVFPDRCDFGWDLVGEVDALKIDEDIAGFHVFGLDDGEGLADDFCGEWSFNHPVSGEIDHVYLIALMWVGAY